MLCRRFFTFTEVTFLETPIAHVPFIYWARTMTVRHSSAQTPMLYVFIVPPFCMFRRYYTFTAVAQVSARALKLIFSWCLQHLRWEINN